MKKYSFLIVLLLLVFQISNAQKVVRVGYIDMEYILEKVPDYAEAKSQLEAKAQQWKQEIETKKAAVVKLKESLKTEKVLLTKELIEERDEEILFQEKELLDFQEKKFGANGDLMIQKSILIKPIQDQVFNIVQEMAELKKYDFIFDKSSDLTMLYAAERWNISDQVIRRITNAEKRKQMTKSQLKAEEEKERKQELIEDNPEAVEAQKKLDNSKDARKKILEDRKEAADAKRKEADELRKKQLDERNAAKNGTVLVKDKLQADVTSPASTKQPDQATIDDAEAKRKSKEERQKVIDDRKKAADDRRIQTLKDRDAAQKAKEEQRNAPKP